MEVDQEEEEQQIDQQMASDRICAYCRLMARCFLVFVCTRPPPRALQGAGGARAAQVELLLMCDGGARKVCHFTGELDDIRVQYRL